ncbi:DUF1206 domain-containing protein [Altericroceibacterium endophyticum]|uniref:DUF1206 domain-containing protein n=1 Tax=Altericroceibacterium endophyticum TaxID=1808508 RepID=A0A6I4T0U1_9SPHN|nr:DUF1206 domain-containing protein [Altericroceibacterium endophyticum]MXO64538.1 DUF1206 domain-containing protein [Altericroceibacterium endophyticum]
MVDKSEKFRWLIRLGFAARGLVYVLLGYLALSTRGSEGAKGVFDYLQEVPLGTPILYLAALGLISYALYRFCSPLFDIENYGSDKKGIAHRIGHAASGLAHVVLAYTAFQFAQGTKQSASGDGGTATEAAGTVLSVSFGSFVLGIVGVGFLIAGIMQAKKGITGDFMRRVSGQAPSFIRYFGHAGYLARGIVFVVIGWAVVRSAWLASTSQIKTLGEAISSLSDNGMLYTAVAAGLLLFGIFSLFLARYRIVPDLGPQGLKPSFRS